MSARTERGAVCQLHLTMPQVQRVLSVLEVAAARIRESDPQMADEFDRDHDQIEAQAHAWF